MYYRNYYGEDSQCEDAMAAMNRRSPSAILRETTQNERILSEPCPSQVAPR